MINTNNKLVKLKIANVKSILRSNIGYFVLFMNNKLYKYDENFTNYYFEYNDVRIIGGSISLVFFITCSVNFFIYLNSSKKPHLVATSVIYAHVYSHVVGNYHQALYFIRDDDTVWYCHNQHIKQINIKPRNDSIEKCMRYHDNLYVFNLNSNCYCYSLRNEYKAKFLFQLKDVTTLSISFWDVLYVQNSGNQLILGNTRYIKNGIKHVAVIDNNVRNMFHHSYYIKGINW